MKAVLISIRPQWCEKIASGKKTIEVRKSAPKEVPFKGYIYATKPKKFYKCGAVSTSDELLWLTNGKVEMGDGFKFWADGDEYQCLNGRVIGEFVCDKVDEWKYLPDGFTDTGEKMYYIEGKDGDKTCLTYDEIEKYGKGKPLYGLHITDLKIYDNPKELSEFRPICKFEGKDAICSLFCPKCKYDGGLFFECTRRITRPPQSWCYVEELK